MKSALLRGREHQRIGEIDTIAEGPAAIAICRGGRSKTYAYTDPNEDAALFAWGEGGALVAVADGHRGFEAAEAALEHLASHPAPQWVEPGGVRAASWESHVLAVLCDANEQVLSEARTPERPARTTLALALVPTDQRVVMWASVGDSHVFLAGPERTEELTAGRSARACFLGNGEENPDGLREKCHFGTRPLGDARAVVLATDGLSEQGVGVEDPAAAVSLARSRAGDAPPPLRARELTRVLLEIALASHRRNDSGDNIAGAAIWLPEIAG